MTQCPECGADAVDSARFCPACGTNLEDAESVTHSLVETADAGQSGSASDDRTLTEAIPGMQPGNTERNVVAGVAWLLAALIVIWAALVAAVVLGAPTDGGTGGQGAGNPAADGGGSAAAASSPTPTLTPRPTPTPTPELTPAPDGQAHFFQGTGGDVSESFTSAGGLMTFWMGHNGQSNFQVYLVVRQP